MEALLRELERQLGRMDEKGRAAAMGAIQGLVGGVMGVGAHLHLPMSTVMRAVGAIGVDHAAGKTGLEVLAKWKAKAAAVGPHVRALFHAF